VTSLGVVKQYWRTFVTLGTGIVLLSAIRQTRQVVIPLWAAHIGLSPTTTSIIYGVAGGIDAAAAALWAWIPRRPHASASNAVPEVMGSQEGQIVLG
jgi:hypothetical protein